MHGGNNWWPPSYDPKRHLHFVPTADAATQYFSLPMDFKPGQITMGGTTRLARNQPAEMAIKAINPDTEKLYGQRDGIKTIFTNFLASAVYSRPTAVSCLAAAKIDTSF